MRNILNLSAPFLNTLKAKQNHFAFILSIALFLSIIFFGSSERKEPRYYSEKEAIEKKADEVLTLYNNLNAESDSLFVYSNSSLGK